MNGMVKVFLALGLGFSVAHTLDIFRLHSMALLEQNMYIRVIDDFPIRTFITG